jgi:hypothetical protein
MLNPTKIIYSLLLCLITNCSIAQNTITEINAVQKISPPYQGFYAKYLDNQGIAIRSAEIVSDSALLVASKKLNYLLKGMPIVRKNLIMNGIELHIIGKNQKTSDLPEFKEMKGVQYMDNGSMTDIDERTRGMGGIYASCGEENLLNLKGDKYAGGYDICIHEFSHSIMDFGLDSLVRSKIVSQYISSVKTQGLWKGAYAATNEQEYWAELTTWYFGAHGDYMKGNKPTAGPKGLKSYDPQGYKLIDSIYNGKILSTLIKKKSQILFSKIPSSHSEQKSKLIIINNSKKTLKLSWVDYHGVEVPLSEILPSTTFSKDTYYAQVWLIDNGKTKTYVKIFDSRCNIELSKDF